MKRCVLALGALMAVMPAVVAAAQAPGPAAERERRPPAVAGDTQQEAQALTQDITRMRSLLQQMEMNLAFGLCVHQAMFDRNIQQSVEHKAIALATCIAPQLFVEGIAYFSNVL